MYLISFSSIFLGWLIQGFLGIGSGIVSTAILLFFFDVKSVVVSLSLLALIGTVLLTFKNYRKKLFLNIVFPLSLFSLIGVYIGSHFLEDIDKNSLKVIFGIVIILTGVYDIIQKSSFELDKKKKSLFLIFTGLSGGFISGVIGGAGPIYAFFLNQILKSKKDFKFIISFIFSVLNLERLAFYIFSEKLRVHFLPEIIIPGFFATIIGVLIGNFLSNSVSHLTFKKLISLTIILSGFYFIFTGLH